MKTTLPIAIQLYSIHEECDRDLAGALRAVAGMGYQGVETAGFAGRTPKEFAAALAGTGLAVEGAHVGLDALLPDAIDRTIADYAVIGCHRLIVPHIGGRWTDGRDGYRRFLAAMNTAADRLIAEGFDLGYHNGAFEFRYGPGGFFPLDLMDAGFTANVKFQFDMGNAAEAGVDGVAFAEAHHGRLCSVHAKPFCAANPVAGLGEDDVDWPSFIAASAAAGADWVVVEHESYSGAPMDCVRRDLEYLGTL